jgi:hypothetical protein
VFTNIIERHRPRSRLAMKVRPLSLERVLSASAHRAESDDSTIVLLDGAEVGLTELGSPGARA